MPPDACIDEPTALAFIGRELADEAAQDIRHHLAECTDCRTLVAELARVLTGSHGGDEGGDAADEDPLHGRARFSVGDELGPHVIERSLGRGSMGEVFLATDPRLNRHVAIKVLAGAGYDGASMRRLRTEARSLARLTHQNVVQVLALLHHDDVPAIVMEYMPGPDLREWLATERSWRAVVEVFLQAGAGLAAAHQAGIVHRDFKPANVLLERADDEDVGTVKVVDFGLARRRPELAASVEPREPSDPSPCTHSSQVTATGSVVGTPAYMAPEVIAGEPADEAADQFSFCVALAEGLCGVRPFRGDHLVQLRREILRDRPHLPASRGVPGRVFEVVRRGLRAEPGDRFSSMHALLSALQSAARSRTRRRTLVASLALMSLAGGFAIAPPGPAPPRMRAALSAMNVPEPAPGVIAELAWLRGELAILRGIAPSLRSDTAVGALHRVAARADALGRQDVRAEAILIEGVHEFGRDISRAEQTLRDAYFLAEEHGAHAIALQAARELARIVGIYRHRLDDGHRWLRHARTHLEHVEDPESAAILADIEAHMLLGARDPEGAAELLRNALRQLPDGHHETRWALQASLGQALSTTNPEEALTVLEGTLLEVEARAGEDAPEALRLLNAISICQVVTRRYDDAIATLHRALRLHETIAGADAPARAGLLGNLGNAHSNKGDHERAIEFFTAAREVDAQAWGQDHPLVADADYNLAKEYYGWQRYEEAARIAQRSLDTYHAAGPKQRRGALNALQIVAQAQLARGRYAAARRAFEQVIEESAALEPDDKNELGWAHGELGRCLTGLREYEAALAAFERALPWYAQVHDTTVKEAARVRIAYADALWGAGRKAEARAQAELALATVTAGLDDASRRRRASAQDWLDTHPVPQTR